MSYEQWLDKQADGNERGLSLKQAYEAGQREMLEKVKKKALLVAGDILSANI